ncbi:MAG: hypothetical protein IID16_00950 [Candidatus Marinimicrobia bacterium]|nr:hypothetical protein [Candidatus Neomarinimicrobiota bacterium]
MKTFKRYENEICEVIKKNNLFVINDIFAFYTGCTRETFYKRNLNKSDSILKSIDDNKAKTCQSLKKKWFDSDNPTLQIALFKSICRKRDLKRLSQTYQDVTSKGKKIQELRIGSVTINRPEE